MQHRHAPRPSGLCDVRPVEHVVFNLSYVRVKRVLVLVGFALQLLQVGNPLAAGAFLGSTCRLAPGTIIGREALLDRADLSQHRFDLRGWLPLRLGCIAGNGAPFKDWVLPAAMERVRRKLAGVDDGNRQMVDILTAVLTDGLPAVEAACAEATAHGVHSADVVLNILARQRDPGRPQRSSHRPR